MIEQADALATWQLALDPLARPDRPIPAVRLPDHRKAYLTYEGPVSGGRGEVRRVEEGWCEVTEFGEYRCCGHLQGRRLVGEYELQRDAAGRWTFGLSPLAAGWPDQIQERGTRSQCPGTPGTQ